MLNWIVLNRIDYFYETDLVLNNPQWLIYHKIQPTKYYCLQLEEKQVP